jgi:hypothetical protein
MSFPAPRRGLLQGNLWLSPSPSDFPSFAVLGGQFVEYVHLISGALHLGDRIVHGPATSLASARRSPPRLPRVLSYGGDPSAFWKSIQLLGFKMLPWSYVLKSGGWRVGGRRLELEKGIRRVAIPGASSTRPIAGRKRPPRARLPMRQGKWQARWLSLDFAIPACKPSTWTGRCTFVQGSTRGLLDVSIISRAPQTLRGLISAPIAFS